MKIGTIAIAAGVLALGLATWTTPGQAQGPLYDRVNVTLPYAVTVGDRVLQPGDYVIQQLRDAGGGSRVLLIYSDNGMKFETSAMTIPALDINTPEKTSVILHHFGKDYYFDKVWIQGKDYGYEFPLPDSVKARERERMAAVQVPATYTTTQQMTEKQETVPPATTTAPQVTEAPATVPSTPAPEPQANREEAPPPPPEMPKTSAGWLMMLLGGTSLSGAGLMLRRKR
jgi:LPXTG-motif cell wall-anchored protein